MAKMSKQELAQFMSDNPDNPVIDLINEQLQDEPEVQEVRRREIKFQGCVKPILIVKTRRLVGFPKFSEIDNDGEYGNFVIK